VSVVDGRKKKCTDTEAEIQWFFRLSVGLGLDKGGLGQREKNGGYEADSCFVFPLFGRANPGLKKSGIGSGFTAKSICRPSLG